MAFGLHNHRYAVPVPSVGPRALPDGSPSIRREILAHLSAHPAAEDTLEGIAEWWLLQQCVEQRVHEVRQALDELVAEGRVTVRRAPGAKSRYSVRQPDGATPFGSPRVGRGGR